MVYFETQEKRLFSMEKEKLSETMLRIAIGKTTSDNMDVLCQVFGIRKGRLVRMLVDKYTDEYQDQIKAYLDGKAKADEAMAMLINKKVN